MDGAHAARRRHALAERVGQLLRQRLGDLDGLEAEDCDADIRRGPGARSQKQAAERREDGTNSGASRAIIH